MADAVFARVETQNVDFPALERAILQFWDDHKIFEQRKQLNGMIEPNPAPQAQPPQPGAMPGMPGM